MRKPSADLQHLLSKAGKIFLIAFLVGLLAGCQVAPTTVSKWSPTNTSAQLPSSTPLTLDAPLGSSVFTTTAPLLQPRRSRPWQTCP